jgi:hypothetical protein
MFDRGLRTALKTGARSDDIRESDPGRRSLAEGAPMSRKREPGLKIPEWIDDLRISAEESELYQQAALVAGIGVEHWVRQVLNRAAKDALIRRKSNEATQRVSMPPEFFKED